MDDTEDIIEYEETDPPQLPRKPYVPEQEPIIAEMEKFKIKVPLVYLSDEDPPDDDWTGN